ncbi:MAG: efflux transporter outer membrane subunit [Candidatus Nucleicultricaceae bacterium]
MKTVCKQDHFYARVLTNHKAIVASIRACVVISVLSLTACSFESEYTRPKTELPKSWALTNETKVSLVSWWKHYNAPKLNELIERVLQHNADLDLAVARVAEARALLGGTDAEQYPSLNGNVIAAKANKLSLPMVGNNALTHYIVAPTLSYEIDLWGRLAKATEAAREQLFVEKANVRAVRLAIIAEAARHYFSIAALNAQIAWTKHIILNRERAFALYENLFSKGTIDELTLRQSRSSLEAAMLELPTLEEKKQLYLNALFVLRGATPADIFNTSSQTYNESTFPPMLPLPNLSPEQVVCGRPDIVRAEHQLAQSHAQISVARAAYLPRLSLSGLLSFHSDSGGKVFDSAPATMIAGSLTGPIFDFGRVRSKVEASEAQQKQAYIAYEQAVRVAFREIMDAITGYKKNKERFSVQEKQIATLKRMLDLANQRFKAGFSTYLDVLDAERSLYQALLNKIEIEKAQVISSVDLYKALGGGSEEEILENKNTEE